MDRRAVHGRKARRDLDGADGVGRLERPHRHHHRAVEAAGRGAVAMLVRYIGTLELLVIWRIGMPSAISASSKENEQPITKVTRSSRQ